MHIKDAPMRGKVLLGLICSYTMFPSQVYLGLNKANC
jgi:hypothetical protein